ncbi:MAG: acetyl-CoA carboxylase biotin carboxylase subunit [Vicingaceae bacterium]
MKKILVANRGEIASRIMRSAREMGIATVAIYSEADRNSPFVKFADEAYCVGPPPSDQSYLKGDLIIEIAKRCGAEGIHPGYGFLSENAAFARKLSEQGIKLIGPSPEAMEIMGSKLAAKAAVKSYDIPMVPGTDEAVADVDEAYNVAKEIGFPVLIKASAGGGGKGMRIVENESELAEQLKRAVSEATSAFGDGSVFIERYVSSPRHIEIQVLADEHGNIVHLFERECSIQRRHQKVIEEAPSSVLSPQLREQMGQCAVNVARACNYIGAGTVEFLLDEKHNFYFLEMNTRLQVEHPVTEFITGLDLVKEQIKVARGEKLSFKQEDIELKGHAIEVRVYAEDPYNGFLPDIGRLETYEPPKGHGVRVDDGFVEGMEIPIYYDPMISKLITYGRDREEARLRMLNAIADYKVRGVATTLDFCHFALSHKAFISGKFDTHFVKNYFSPSELEGKEEQLIGALAAAILLNDEKENKAIKKPIRSKSAWKRR